ncbi:MAG: dTDP-4-dehydrorhamnose reductase [Saprospiraceae bacterium]|nr:dTDP-4-dehydrorhamnose reductase [Saprospiraceae bacterium]
MILVTGANGQLGQCFRQLADQNPKVYFYFAGSSELDITNKRMVRKFFEQHPVSWCINCAAYTAVDQAQKEPAVARKINISGVKNLAEACAPQGIPLIHFSTDYVYHTKQNTPFKEDNPVSPKSVYARTKRSGERAALLANPNTMVIRTSWVYSEFAHNFVKTMLRLGRERSNLNVVYDQIGTPTYAPDLAAAVLDIIRKAETEAVPPYLLAGIWHYSNEGVTSWYDFAKAIFEIKNIPCVVQPIESKAYPTPAMRPHFSLMDKSKIRTAFGLQIPHWRESLLRCLEKLD